MQQLASSATSRSLVPFANLLADLATPAKDPSQRDLVDLEDDVAILSYEQALRNHGRPAAQLDQDPAPARPIAAGISLETSANPRRQPARRSSSVTVRLSALEAEQLRARAAEAGLTVSAYLRSCAFEVEILRAEVKSTLCAAAVPRRSRREAD